MDALEPVPRAGAVSRRVHEHLVTASSSNQTFEHITASGSSRVHNGNNYYITYECSTDHDPLPMSSDEQHAIIAHVSRSSQKRKRSVSNVPERTPDNRERQTLTAVLESLGQYSKSMQQQSEGEQSEKIAAQLAIILESFEQAASNGEDTGNLDRQLRDLKDQLRRAKRIEINAASPQAHTSRQYMAQSKLAKITFGQWEISLSTKILHSRSTDGRIITETCSALRVQSALGFRGPCIAAFFGESVDVRRTEMISPIVVAYNHVGYDAEVIRLVRDDDLDGLMKLLARGQASIRDCDEKGRSLLHYACYRASEETCKFLVDSGCDLDRTALSFDGDDLKETPLSSFGFIVTDMDDILFERSLTCRKHLLQAGADPTLGTVDTSDDSASESTIIEALQAQISRCRATDFFEQVVHGGSAFFDVRTFRVSGQSIWMHACSEAATLASPKILEILVQAGAMIAEVDENGWNCLFKCVVLSARPRHSNEFEALRYLLTIFKDIFARDVKGRSIFDIVVNDETGRDDCYGSYRQDLWYCALYRSGLAQRSNIPLPPPGSLKLDTYYRPALYRTLLYLDTWNFPLRFDKTCVPNYCSVDKNALSLQERQAAPGLREWNPSDLVMMEERISQSIDEREHRHEALYRSYRLAMAGSRCGKSQEQTLEEEEEEEEEDLSS